MKVKIQKLRKKDLLILKKHWKVYEPFLNRYNSMKKGESTFLIIWNNEIPIGHGRIWWKKVPVIEDMSVNKDFRSKGIGSILLNRLELYAKRRAYNQVRLYVELKNKKAEMFYLRKNYFLTGNIINNENEMEKKLK